MSAGMSAGMSDRDALKREAGAQAADMIENGMVVGLGTGSTAAFFIEALIARAKAGLDVVCIPTSERSAAQARAGGLSLASFATHRRIDIAIDGADEIKRDSLDLVKGLGGALLREKIVASAAKSLIIIADSGKLVDWLGVRAPIPVEVVRFGWELAAERLAGLGGEPVLRMHEGGDPFLTDGGNHILDYATDAIADPRALDRAMRDIVGVVGTGLFVGMTTLALVADDGGVTRYTPR